MTGRASGALLNGRRVFLLGFSVRPEVTVYDFT
jgi:hypothetical protein